jgi:RHS repeat-associated protein
VQDATGTATISHDAAGNIVGDGSFTYAYSDRGRMASVTTASGTVSYLYNGQGQRAKKSGPTALVQTGASHFVYDEAGQLLGEYDANGNPVYETIYLGSTPVGALKQTGSATTSDIAVTLYNVHADHIDTPRLITKQDQTVVWRWDAAEAFGATAPDQNPTGQGVFAYNPRFPGQVFDAESGLFQNWNRDYDARLGRYRQSDPIGLAGGINTYAYVEGRPTEAIDPSGEFLIVPILIGAFSGAAIDIGIQLWNNGGNWACVDRGEVLVAAASGALLSGLGPTGFLLGRGGTRALAHGYSRAAGLLNKGVPRFGWGYSEKANVDVIRAVTKEVPKNDFTRTAIPAGARPVRDGALAGAVGAAATANGYNAAR